MREDIKEKDVMNKMKKKKKIRKGERKAPRSEKKE